MPFSATLLLAKVPPAVSNVRQVCVANFMTNFCQELDRDSLYCNVSVQSLLGQFVRSSFCSWALRFIRKMKSNGAKSCEKFYENPASVV